MRIINLMEDTDGNEYVLLSGCANNGILNIPNPLISEGNHAGTACFCT